MNAVSKDEYHHYPPDIQNAPGPSLTFAPTFSQSNVGVEILTALPTVVGFVSLLKNMLRQTHEGQNVDSRNP